MATYNVGNLSEGLLFQVFRTLVFIVRGVDRDKLVRNLFLLEDRGHTLSASGLRHAIELQNHDDDRMCTRREFGRES